MSDTTKPALPEPDKLDPNEQDAVTLWAEIWRLRTALQGPDGYATWQDAATAERMRRVKAEAAVAEARAETEALKSDIADALTTIAVYEAEARAVPDYRHVANEWADMAINGLQWLRNIVDGVSTPADALANMEECVKHCRQVNDALAATPHHQQRSPYLENNHD